MPRQPNLTRLETRELWALFQRWSPQLEAHAGVMAGALWKSVQGQIPGAFEALDQKPELAQRMIDEALLTLIRLNLGRARAGGEFPWRYQGLRCALAYAAGEEGVIVCPDAPPPGDARRVHLRDLVWSGDHDPAQPEPAREGAGEPEPPAGKAGDAAA